MRNIFSWTTILLCIVACHKKDIPEPLPLPGKDNSFLSFSFKYANNPLTLLNDIKCNISGDTIRGRVPYLTKLDSMAASFTVNGVLVQVNGQPQISDSSYNNFENPVTYTVLAEDGTSKNYTIILTQFTSLPIVSIKTDNSLPVDSKDTYRDASMTIIPNGFPDAAFSGKLRIKGRGNSTWVMPKKPYRLKLDSKASIMGMPADKDWVLLANYADKSLMRNKIAFSINEMFAPDYTPRSHFVELFLNGEYMGNYLLTEHIKVAKNRVNVSETSEADGGYLLEVDARLDEDNWFYTERGVPICIKSPDADDINAAQLTYIKNYVQEAENAIYAENFTDPENGFRKYIDEESFIKWYWTNEFMKNTDAIFFSSVFMYKTTGGKLFLGPVWDFDIGGGNINYNDNGNTSEWWVRASIWINRLFQDPAFKKKANEMWIQAQPKLSTIPHLIDVTAQQLRFSQKENFDKWNILDTGVWPNLVVLGSYENEVQYFKYWLDKRLKWINSEINAEP